MHQQHLPEPAHSEHPARQKFAIALAVLAVLPALVVRFAGVHPEPLVAAILVGLAVVGGAFMLAWAAEVAQLDISAGLAIALLALIAVYAALDEWLQSFVGRDMDLRDWLADMAGATATIALLEWKRRARSRAPAT